MRLSPVLRLHASLPMQWARGREASLPWLYRISPKSPVRAIARTGIFKNNRTAPHDSGKGFRLCGL